MEDLLNLFNDFFNFIIEGSSCYWRVTDTPYKIINLIWIISTFFVIDAKFEYRKYKEMKDNGVQLFQEEEMKLKRWKLLLNIGSVIMIISMILTFGGYPLLYLFLKY